MDDDEDEEVEVDNNETEIEENRCTSKIFNVMQKLQQQTIVTQQTTTIVTTITPLNVKTSGFNTSSAITPLRIDVEQHLKQQEQQRIDRMRTKRKNYEDQDEDTIEFNATSNTIDSNIANESEQPKPIEISNVNELSETDTANSMDTTP